MALTLQHIHFTCKFEIQIVCRSWEIVFTEIKFLIFFGKIHDFCRFWETALIKNSHPAIYRISLIRCNRARAVCRQNVDSDNNTSDVYVHGQWECLLEASQHAAACQVSEANGTRHTRWRSSQLLSRQIQTSRWKPDSTVINIQWINTSKHRLTCQAGTSVLLHADIVFSTYYWTLPAICL